MPRLLICASILILAAGCAANVPATQSANVATTAPTPVTTSTVAGTANLHIIWPCYLSAVLFPDAMKPDWKVLLDGKQIGVLTAGCHQKQFAVPAGRHTIRLGDPFIDFGALFPLNEQFALPSGEHLYLIVKPRGGNAGADLIEISAARGKEEIAAVDSH